MSTLRRSTTGCTFCKTRRKKCDETKPRCLRCISSGRSCSYDYVETPEGDRPRVKRTKPAPRTTRELLARASQTTPTGLPNDNIGISSTPSTSEDSFLFAHSIPLEIQNNIPISSSGFVSSSSAAAIPSVTSQLLCDTNTTYSSSDSSSLVRLPYCAPCTYNTGPIASSSTSRPSVWLGAEEGDDDDPEGVRLILCEAPALDKNAKDNTLPFVLHCYSRWVIVSVFEPLRIVHTMRDQVMAQFSFENTRTRTILIANVMDVFVKNFIIDGTRKVILDRLASNVQKSGVAFMATQPSMAESDRRNAIRALDCILEVIGLQLNTQPAARAIQLLDYARLVFRRACPEPPGQPVNLPNILLGPSLNLRHFATIDVMISVTSGRPTHFQYEVPFSLELCKCIYQRQLQGNCGLQWLYGLPDQFILFFAWINSLSETPGAGNNLQLIAWIEGLLPQIEIAIDGSGDPALRIGRLVVQECWRFAVQVYLYMVLCKANAHDPRVVRSQKGYMRLLRGVKPGRRPDFYLVTSMTVIGVATTEKWDQDTLRQRFQGLPECAERGTAANGLLLELEDIWARTRGEGRPAVWPDLRAANIRLTGR